MTDNEREQYKNKLRQDIFTSASNMVMASVMKCIPFVPGTRVNVPCLHCVKGDIFGIESEFIVISIKDTQMGLSNGEMLDIVGVLMVGVCSNDHVSQIEFIVPKRDLVQLTAEKVSCN